MFNATKMGKRNPKKKQSMASTHFQEKLKHFIRLVKHIDSNRCVGQRFLVLTWCERILHLLKTILNSNNGFLELPVHVQIDDDNNNCGSKKKKRTNKFSQMKENYHRPVCMLLRMQTFSTKEKGWNGRYETIAKRKRSLEHVSQRENYCYIRMYAIYFNNSTIVYVLYRFGVR